MQKIFLIIFLGLLVPVTTHAHGLVTTLTEISGSYIVEFEYDSLGSIQAGNLVTYNTHLLDQNKQPVRFDSAFLRITNSSGAPLLVGNLKETMDLPGTARLSGVLPGPGAYRASVQFQKSNGETILTANFKFNVAPTAQVKSGDPKQLILFGVVGLVVGLGAGMLLQSMKKSND